MAFFFFSSRRRHTRLQGDWSSDVCSSDLVVLGFVKDAAGKPVAGRAIEVVRDKTGFSYLAQTDARGLYVAVTRLGDESAGETLTVKVGTLVRKVTATFDAANHAEDRG